MNTTVKIFLVDDDLSSLNFFREDLEKSGYEDVSLFLNSTICLNNLYQKPKLIFLNPNLTEFKGLEILKKIKRYDSGIYVIIFTNKENIQDATEALKHGAFDYILKEDWLLKAKNLITRIESIEVPDNIVSKSI
jgi:DNA-binding NtrC family response regulator